MTTARAGDYELLDSGAGRKLERLGAHVLDRQAAAAVWRRRLDDKTWDAAEGIHHRSETGGGHWEFRRKLPETWTVRHGDLLLEIKPTPFGHLGLFAEQVEQWAWLRSAVKRAEGDGPPRILNLFAYTGGTTLALSAAGAEVCHVDAARGIVDWARKNAELNGLSDRPVRWIVDDCMGFLRREQRRGRRYDGIVLDPPSFGRGRQQEIFKIDRDICELLRRCREVLCDQPLLFLLTCHTPGYSAGVLDNLVGDMALQGTLQGTSGEMGIKESASGRRLPAGSFSRLIRE